jgi:glutaredoxin
LRFREQLGCELGEREECHDCILPRAASSRIGEIERRSSMNSPAVILYTRQGCHLCDDALALLKRHGLAPREIDIDADPELRAKYDVCVPVVEIDGRVRFRGRVDERLLRRLLASGKG